MITLAFTRPVRRLAESVTMAENMGFRVLAAPSLEILPGDEEDFRSIREQMKKGSFDITIISSVTAAEECLVAWGSEFTPLMNKTEVIPIGQSTADYLEKREVCIDSLPSEYSSSGIVDLLADRIRKKKILLVHSDHGSNILDIGLRMNGARVTELIAYRLEKKGPCTEFLNILEEGKKRNIDLFAFTSPMSAESFIDTLISLDCDSEDFFKGAKIAAIGKPTALMLASKNIKTDILPDKSTFECLLKEINQAYRRGDKMTKKGIMIVGHGSRYEYNKNIMELQKERLTKIGYKNVYIGFNETSHPFIEETLVKMADEGIEEIVAIPFFIASGLHMTRDIPPKLRLAADEKDKMIDVNGHTINMHFEPPFGDDPLLAKILYEKVQELNNKNGRTGVMVIGHGSRLPYNKEIISLNAQRLREMGLKDVYYAFNEFNDPKIEPTLEEMLSAGVDMIIALPLFISAGDHLKNDIPEKIRLTDGVYEGTFDHKGKMKTVKYATPIGQDPRLTDVLVDRLKKYY